MPQSFPFLDPIIPVGIPSFLISLDLETHSGFLATKKAFPFDQREQRKMGSEVSDTFGQEARSKASREESWLMGGLSRIGKLEGDGVRWLMSMFDNY